MKPTILTLTLAATLTLVAGGFGLAKHHSDDSRSVAVRKMPPDDPGPSGPGKPKRLANAYRSV